MPRPQVKNQRPTKAESKAALNAQAPSRKQSSRPTRMSSLKIARPTSTSMEFTGDKYSLQDLQGIEFYITGIEERNTNNGPSYIFNILVGDDGDEGYVWAGKDDTRDAIAEEVYEMLKNNDAVGPYSVTVLEPKRRGFNGYCRIYTVSTDTQAARKQNNRRGKGDDVPF